MLDGYNFDVTIIRKQNRWRFFKFQRWNPFASVSNLKKKHFPAAPTKNFEFNFLFKGNCSWKSCFRDFEIFLDKMYTKYFLDMHCLKHNNKLAIAFWNITKVFARKEILGQIYFTPVATSSKIVIKPLWFLMQFFEALQCDNKVF